MKNLTKLTFAALMLALSLLLPLLTGQLQQIGSLMLPMHIPVLICGLICGWQYGLVVGFIAPLLRSFIFGMPPLFPIASAMALELAAYGFFAGLIFLLLPKKPINTYISLVAAMFIGRLFWGGAMFFFSAFFGIQFSFEAFLAGGFITALPGILLHIVIIPPIVMALQRVQGLSLK